ncbi:MAG: PEP/pyruvate-binding domain-containing protein [Bacteroidales bacterium]|jgi:CheY-like chemotaxis protein|nr:PEP/pyruvate-binding domain-containing protein [Bacteroidales bacterium]
MVSTNLNDPEYKRLLQEQNERLKELACINQTTAILKEGKRIEEALQQIVMVLPAAWQYPEYTVARISLGEFTITSPDFAESDWKMYQDFKTIDGQTGRIEIFYTMEFRREDEGPFLSEERDLLQNISSLITGYINSRKATDIMRLSLQQQQEKEEAEGRDISSRKLLQRFLDRHNAERDVFHDLMPFKVKEILLIANLYDAYSIEGEGRFSDMILGEYYQLNLTSIPRVTGVSGEDEVFSRLKSRHYDLIIIMVGVDRETPLKLCRKIKEEYPYVTTYLLLNNPCDVEYVKEKKDSGVPFDNYFVWTGESKVFFAMVKLLEDRVNVENDTKRGLTRVILIVEDSALYYSSYLPMLYNLVLEQTQHLIEDISTDELYKLLKLRARPKILLATTFEEALIVFNTYRDYLLCVISDMRFPRAGILSNTAGYDLIRTIKNEFPNLPSVLQSSDPDNARYAHALRSSFINKNSESLLQDIRSFITYYLGFGSFVYRDTHGKQIAVAKTMKEFESYLETIPEDSLVYHAMKNHFSLWLMARGEVNIAKTIGPMKVSDFESLRELREFILNIIRKRRREMNMGKVINFEESAIIDETNVVSLAGGSLGGKGRGLAFINTLIYSFDLGRLLPPGVVVKSPVTAIIGTDEFDMFMERNHLWEKIKEVKDYEELKKIFIAGSLSYSLDKELKVYLRHMIKPLAIRSSSLFEDSMSQPFSGIFGTYLLPNNHPDFDVRYRHVCEAIKLVFVSIYSKTARTYFEAINYKVEQEKMAVVIQEVVGNRFENAFYPHISGTAQSYNFYPVAHMTPEDGFAVIALGLGQYVVEGEKAYRFSPAYPEIDIVSQRDLYRNSQVCFYAVDMDKQSINLLEGENAGLVKLDLSDAERHNTLRHCASVYNPDNDTITPGLESHGPRVVNFANILKYDYMPLAGTLKIVLDVVKEAFGTPVEIEFAVDLKRDASGNVSFYLLQIKPMVGTGSGYTIDEEALKQESVILKTHKSMGNGLVDYITDIVFIEPDLFDNTLTEKMAKEIEEINDIMLKENRKYVLIGPGRWGTRDKFIGVPVVWPQISNAKVIVEVSLPDFPLDASLGSHFFHNVTSMNVGYFSVNHTTPEDFVDWDILRSQEVVFKGNYFRQVRFGKPIMIRMDGKNRVAVVSFGPSVASNGCNQERSKGECSEKARNIRLARSGKKPIR